MQGDDLAIRTATARDRMQLVVGFVIAYSSANMPPTGVRLMHQESCKCLICLI